MPITDTITTQWLKDRYLFGIDLTDDSGTSYPDGLYETAINSAVATIEKELDITLSLTTFTERYDSNDSMYDSYMLMHLMRKPVREITKFEVQFGNFPATEIPLSWIHISNAIGGQIQVIPGQEGLGGALYGAATPFLGLSGVLGRPYTPQWFKITYKAGYDGSTYAYPPELLDAVGLIAAMLPLDTAGDLLIGAGVASKSISMDGLSTSVNTTSSATNSGYGARIGTYADRLKTLLDRIRRSYRVPQMFVL